MISSSSIKVLLLLTALAFVCQAQRNQAGQQCLCSTVSTTVGSRKNISDIQIFPVSNFCNKVEIVISTKQGARYCLDSSLPIAKTLVNKIFRK